MEATIFNGFRSVLHQLIQMRCAWHLQVRDENETDSYHQLVCIPDKQKASYKSRIAWKIYGEQIAAAFCEGFN